MECLYSNIDALTFGFKWLAAIYPAQIWSWAICARVCRRHIVSRAAESWGALVGSGAVVEARLGAGSVSAAADGADAWLAGIATATIVYTLSGSGCASCACGDAGCEFVLSVALRLPSPAPSLAPDPRAACISTAAQTQPRGLPKSGVFWARRKRIPTVAVAAAAVVHSRKERK